MMNEPRRAAWRHRVAVRTIGSCAAALGIALGSLTPAVAAPAADQAAAIGTAVEPRITCTPRVNPPYRQSSTGNAIVVATVTCPTVVRQIIVQAGLRRNNVSVGDNRESRASNVSFALDTSSARCVSGTYQGVMIYEVTDRSGVVTRGGATGPTAYIAC